MSREEVVKAVTEYVARKFCGDWEALFRHYDADADDNIAWDDLERCLQDAGVTPRWAHRIYVKAIFAELDTDEDGLISVVEFMAAFENHHGDPGGH